MFLILRQILIVFPHQTYKLNDLVYVVVGTLLKLIHTVISNLFCILYISIAAYECTANLHPFQVTLTPFDEAVFLTEGVGPLMYE